MYNTHEEEKRVLEFWKKQKIYDKLKKRNMGGKKFYFLQGPPYTSGKMHIGHAWNNSLKDIVLRYKRMQGLNVWDRAGYDMHGLPTENAVQKKLGIKDKLGIEKYGVEKFIKECIKFSSENVLMMNKDLERLGIWMDFENAYLPIKQDFIEGEWWLIKKAWEQKRLYKGKKIMQWCGHCETSLAKHELEYENVKENSIFLKFKVKDNQYLIVWTTTPWTIPFNLAVMVNPEIDYIIARVHTDKGEEDWIVAKALANVFISGLLELKFKIIEEFKGKKLEGLEYIHPMSQLKDIYDGLKKKWKKAHTVLLSTEYVDTTTGSGLVHCAPGCGPEDYEVGKKYGIDAFNETDEKGYFVGMGELSGLRAKQDDKKIVELLKKSGSIITETQIEHEYAHCWRCHKPVIFRATEQWFLKIEDLISKLLDFNKKVKWQPKFASKNYDLWIENLKDNGLTRQRYWGCPIPIWQCSCGNIEVIASAEEIKKKGGKVPADLHKPWIDSVKLKCTKCKKEMDRAKDIIDVWVDSGTTSWNCLYYPQKEEYIQFWPADFILEAVEQIKLWFSMLQMCSAITFGKSSYKNVYCHGMILDYQGLKMSKSLGNIISPYEIIDKYGSDILRYYMCETPSGENINFSWEDVKIKQRNLNILWNLSEYVLELHREVKKNPEKLKVKNGLEEEYILSKLNSTIEEITRLFEEYKIDETITKIEALFLELSRTYVQFTREKDREIVFATAYEMLSKIIQMFSTISPFISEAIWQKFKELVKEESVHLCKWPSVNKKSINLELEKEFSIAKEVIEKALAIRAEQKIGVRWPLSKVIVKIKKEKENAVKKLSEIIKTQLNVKNVDIMIVKDEERVELDTKITPKLEAEGYAREIVRRIQDARKKAGLKKDQKIDLLLQLNEKLRKIVEEYKEMLADKVNAVKLETEDLKKETKKHKNSFEDSIKGEKIVVNFTIIPKG
ncbi:isoleucine--tRNA ligase [Candidatus Pacearchaeota archaeon]|nr:isoleucine--tRNA ligase [Candidatus Pacearchaeota archaeon]